MKHLDDRLDAQSSDEEVEDESDIEERACAERLFAKVDARKKVHAGEQAPRTRRTHPMAKGDDVHAAFTIAASDLVDAMKATRLPSSKALREMMIVGSDLRVTASMGDVRFSFDVPISDVYIRSGKATF